MLGVKQETYVTPDIVNLLKSEEPKMMMLQVSLYWSVLWCKWPGQPYYLQPAKLL